MTLLLDMDLLSFPSAEQTEQWNRISFSVRVTVAAIVLHTDVFVLEGPPLEVLRRFYCSCCSSRRRFAVIVSSSVKDSVLSTDLRLRMAFVCGAVFRGAIV